VTFTSSVTRTAYCLMQDSVMVIWQESILITTNCLLYKQFGRWQYALGIPSNAVSSACREDSSAFAYSEVVLVVIHAGWAGLAAGDAATEGHLQPVPLPTTADCFQGSCWLSKQLCLFLLPPTQAHTEFPAPVCPVALPPHSPK